MKLKNKISLICFSFFFATNTLANSFFSNGAGGISAALGNTGVAYKTGFEVFYNPALLNSNKDNVVFDIKYISQKLNPIHDITIKNSINTLADSPKILGDGDNSYFDVYNIAFEVNKSLPYNFAIGGLISTPINKIVYFNTLNNFTPTYIFYKSKYFKPYLSGAISYSIFDYIHLGIALNFYFNINANANFEVIDSSAKYSNEEFSGSIKPGITPKFGFAYDITKFVSFASTYEPSHQYDINLNVNGIYSSSIVKIPLEFQANALSHYEPAKFAAGFKFTLFDIINLNTDYIYSKWSALNFSSSRATYQAPKIANGETQTLKLKNTNSYRFGIELLTNDYIKPRLGFDFSTSSINMNELANSNLNFIDTNKYTYTIGLGIILKEFEFDLSSQYQHLKNTNIVKDQNLIGGPGYNIGGHTLTLGGSLNYKF